MVALGAQFNDSFGAEPVRSNAIAAINNGRDPRRPGGVLTRDAVKTIYRATNIRSWPLKDHPEYEGNDYKGTPSPGFPDTNTMDSVRHDEPLHTSQAHLHGPTLERYMHEGAPETEFVNGEEDWEVPYSPDVTEDRHGNTWINEGHHRMVASRLRGDYSTDVYKGYRD
jgi:hypothetical protein